MKLFDFGLGLIAGVFLGVGVSIFYLRWKVSRQLGMMQNNMEDMFEMSEEMTEGLATQMDAEEVEAEEFEEKEKD